MASCDCHITTAAANQNCSSPRLQYPGSHHLWRQSKHHRPRGSRFALSAMTSSEGWQKHPGGIYHPESCNRISSFFSVQRLHGFRQVVTHVQPQHFLFFSQRLYGFRQVVTHVQSQQKDELQLSCKAVYLLIATKVLVMDLYTVQ